MSKAGVCQSSLQQEVSHGQYFTPSGKDICEKCQCLAGKAVGCFFEKCPQLPECGDYRPVEGTCCEFECLQDNGLSDKTELAVLFSLGTGLVLLLIILILVLYCRRQGIKRSQEEHDKVTKTQSVTEQSTTTTTTTTTSPEVLPTNAESIAEGRVELPPPYSAEPRCVNGARTKTPPNEPPPPYVDREESAV
ncbi:integral membrane DGCR2 IDD-like isoform X2 [Paramuricea clavata]|uniref:Integral membrane DGCR2 IDD-like isoform X2 n=1 Tax=Paramuricea clavata TaxID=317549 RepID=A0A6S7HV27_PARCT|nr:integral membrane DGCR2 IDD-like isoform X2 [Paramuricea clavata]